MSRHYVDHYDMCDTIKLECGEQFCPDHDENQPAYKTHVEDTFTSLLHERGACPECDSCWADVDANAAYDAAQAAPTEVTCPLCEGAGELVECVNDGTHGCSHSNDREYRCHGCGGEGDVPATSVDREGDLITFTGCDCDEDSRCFDAKCQMERDLEMRHMQALYRAGALTAPRDLQRQMYAGAMFDAGRDYLLRDDERLVF